MLCIQSNEELIENYGFFLENNPQDFVWVSVAMRPEDPLASMRSEVLSLAGLDQAGDTTDVGVRSLSGWDEGNGTGIRFYLRR